MPTRRIGRQFYAMIPYQTLGRRAEPKSGTRQEGLHARELVARVGTKNPWSLCVSLSGWLRYDGLQFVNMSRGVGEEDEWLVAAWSNHAALKDVWIWRYLCLFRTRDESPPIVRMHSQRRAYAGKELNRARTVSGGVPHLAVISDHLAAGLQHPVPDAIASDSGA